MLTKRVGNKSVEMSNEEELETRSEWAANLLIENEEQRVKSIDVAGLERINIMFPSLNNINDIKFQAEFWLSIKPEARQPTVDFQFAIDVYTAAKTAVANGTLSKDVVWPSNV